MWMVGFSAVLVCEVGDRVGDLRGGGCGRPMPCKGPVGLIGVNVWALLRLVGSFVCICALC